MPIDPTIPLGGNSQQFNPLQALTQVTQLSGNMLQQQALGQQIGANRAASEAMQQAFDPATGKVDYNKFAGVLSQDPRGAYNLPAIQGQIATQQNQQQDLQSKKYDLALKNQNGFRTQLGSLMMKDDLSPQDVVQVAASAVNNGVLTPEIASKELSTMPSDPGQLRAWVAQHYTSALSGEAQLKAMQPNMMTVNNGGATSILPMSPMTGQIQGAPTVIQNTLTPGEASANVNVFDPGSGTMRTITKAQQLAMQGGNPATGAMPVGAAPAGSQPQAGGLGSGRLTQPAAAPAGAPGLQAAPALGAATGADKAAGLSADQWGADHQTTNGTAQRVYQLQQALSGLQNTTTGKGSENLNDIKSYLLTSGIGQKLGIDPNKVASYDEANKYLTQYAISQASSMGQGTNEKLGAALTGNASTSISNLAAQDVVKANIGLERMKQAQTAAFDAAGLPPEQYAKWSAQWNKAVDPRVFISDQLTPQQRQDMASKMSPQQLSNFRGQYNAAVQSGLIPDPRGGQ